MVALKDVLHQKTVDALEELFASYETEVQFKDALSGNNEEISGYLGMIGFSGTLIKGNVSIWCGSALLEKTGNADVNKPDWIAEIANQFIGRLKNKLLKYGVEIMLGTPTSIDTASLTLNFVQDNVKKYCFVHNETEEVIVFMDAVFDESVSVEESEQEDESVEEGDLLLF